MSTVEFGQLPLLDQGADMIFIGKARHRVVGLRLQPGAGDPPGGERLEDRKAAAAGEAVNQRRDEDGLAGARQPGDAKPDRRIEKLVAIVLEGPRRQPRFLHDILKAGGHAGAGQLGLADCNKLSAKWRLAGQNQVSYFRRDWN